jgi:hypothetical protein
MPITLDEVSKEIKLDLPDLPKSVERSIKEEVAEFVITSVLEYVGDGRSPVTGQQFKQLSKDYADEEKGGRRSPNLDLEGDMLNSLTWKSTKAGISVGIFDSSQTPKAFNHNTGDTLPKRQFIPTPRQSFVGNIEEGVRRLVNERLGDVATERFVERTEPRRAPTENSSAVRSTIANTTAFEAILGEDTITQIVRDILGRE